MPPPTRQREPPGGVAGGPAAGLPGARTGFLTVSGASATDNADVDPVLTPAGLRTRARDYLGATDPATPSASPIFADLTGLPPLLIQVGTHEILLDDAVRLAARAAACNVRVDLQVWPGVPHVFQSFAAMLDEGGAALRSAAEFIRSHWAMPGQAADAGLTTL
jgi:acetyl esterase/lipase